MKKYEKPAIEVVEANLSADCLQIISNNEGYDENLAPGRKGKDYDDDDDFGIEDW